jgi:hypothetical protein
MSTSTPTALLIEVGPNHFINLAAAIEIEQDPDEPQRVIITLPATGYEPATPLLVEISGELAQLVLVYAARQAAASVAALRAVVSAA